MNLFDERAPEGSLAASEMRCHVDGASRGNPGEAGFGVLAHWQGKDVELYGYLGKATNNVAEYFGFLCAALYARSVGARGLKVFSDSELIVKQLQGYYRVKNPALARLHRLAIDLLEPLERFEITHIPREENKRADKLANIAVDLKASKYPEGFPEGELPRLSADEK